LLGRKRKLAGDCGDEVEHTISAQKTSGIEIGGGTPGDKAMLKK